MKVLKTSILLFFAILTAQFAFGQEFQIEHGNTFTIQGLPEKRKIVCHKGNAYMVSAISLYFNSILKEQTLAVFDETSLQLKSSRVVIGETNKKDTTCLSYNKYSMIDLIALRSGVYMLNSVHDGGEDALILSAQKVGVNSEFIGKNRHIASAKSPSADFKGDFTLAFSQDSSKMIIVEEHFSRPNAGKKDIGIKIFNDEFQLKQEIQISIPFSHKGYKLIDYKIRNDGFIYMLGHTPNDLWPPTSRYYSIIIFNPQTKALSEHKIELQNGHVAASAHFEIDEVYKNLVVAGTYFVIGETNKVYKESGFHLGRYDIATGKKLEGKDFEITKSLFASNQESSKLWTRDTVDLYRYSLVHLIPEIKGSVSLTFKPIERQYIKTKEYVRAYSCYRPTVNISISNQYELLYNSAYRQFGELHTAPSNCFLQINRSNSKLFLFNDYDYNYEKPGIYEGKTEDYRSKTSDIKTNIDMLGSAVINTEGLVEHNAVVRKGDYSRKLDISAAYQHGEGVYLMPYLTKSIKQLESKDEETFYDYGVARVIVK